MKSMTVKDLMEALAGEDPEAIVYAYIPERYLKSIFYEALFTIEEVAAQNGSPKRVTLFSDEPKLDSDDLNSWPESFRHEYVLKEESE